MFMEIHDIIVEENKKSGIRPSSPGQSPGSLVRRQDLDKSLQYSSPHSASMLEPTGFKQDNHASEDTLERRSNVQDQTHGNFLVAAAPQPPKTRPAVHPKSDRIHALNSRSTNGTTLPSSTDDLAERLARLRAPPSLLPAPLPYPLNGGLVDIPSSTSFPPSPIFGSQSKPSDVVPGTAYDDGRPSEPRRTPLLPSVPAVPPKLPLNTRLAASLPRAPSPTYSPARNSQTPPNTVPSRSAVRGYTSIEGKPSQASSTGSSYTTSYKPLAVEPYEQPRSRPQPRTHFQELPNPTAISAQELFDRLRLYSILLIDVRTREEFDDGHVYHSSIMCIEPLLLPSGISAEGLEERLIISPKEEEDFFMKRDDYDLVVYYDQTTKSNHFLEGPPKSSLTLTLKALHECLFQFNYSKKLRRPPAVLLGGLDAWIDLVGPQALQTSETAARIATARIRRAPNGSTRPSMRTVLATPNSSREVQRRRLTNYNPLNADEERVWLEKAKEEEVESTDYQAHSDGDGDGDGDGDTDAVTSHLEEPQSPLVTSYEDFLRRFPEPGAIQQSMVGFRQGPRSRPPPLIPPMPSRPPPAAPRPSYSGVSERDATQLSPTARLPPSAQLPLYTSRSISHYLKLPRTGLINFSVTCYMNATIQCLLATIPLSQFFLDNRWRSFIQKNWKGSNGIMPEIYANLIRSLWKNDVQAVRPSSLRNFCTRLNREWGLDRQQDAKEFLEFLVDCLHEDLNINWERRPLRPLTTDEELRRERMPVSAVSRLEWERYSHRECSFISSLFAGQHASRLRCTTCGNTSTTYEAFYSISVEIPRSGVGDIRDCLRSYCQEEMLSGDEVWKCPYCKCEREATKRITLTRIPQVLVIHFKRFSASKTESARKVHTPIEFPLYGLNMEPYMAPTRVDPKSQPDAKASQDAVEAAPPDPAITPPFQFDAYAVMRHLGQTGNGGHYIALVRDAVRGCWRKFDDERATDFDPAKLRNEQRLQNEQAYIVFYGRSAAR